METINSLSVKLDIQNPIKSANLPLLSEMKVWCESAIQNQSHHKAFDNSLSVLIRIVDSEESADLNNTYRQKQGPTNVLSFPNEVPEFMFGVTELDEDINEEQIIELNEQKSYLGDLVICESLLQVEAAEQSKSVVSHWAHLIIHGILHLQGFDHIDDKEALEMEALEIQILEQLGFVNPYTN